MGERSVSPVECPWCHHRSPSAVAACPKCGHLLAEYRRRHRREGAILLIALGVFIIFFGLVIDEPNAHSLKQLKVWGGLIAGLGFSIRFWNR